LSNGRSAALQCIACHANLTSSSLDHCPRCGADNRAWHAWVSADRREHLERFFLRSAWGRLALVSLLLPPVSWVAFHSGFFASRTLTLLMSSLLSLTGLYLLFTSRDALWTYELTHKVVPRFGIGLLPLGGVGNLIFSAVAAGLVVTSPVFTSQGLGVAVVLVGLAFTAQTLGAGLYAVYAYGRWLSRTFPKPIFLQEACLSQLVIRATKPRIQVKTGDTYETVTTQVAARSRTAQAGLIPLIRAEAGTDEVWEGHYLKAVQHWRVVSDKWGRVTQLKLEGPLEYVPDLGRVCRMFDLRDGGKALDGEIILPEKKVFSR